MSPALGPGPLKKAIPALLIDFTPLALVDSPSPLASVPARESHAPGLLWWSALGWFRESPAIAEASFISTLWVRAGCSETVTVVHPWARSKGTDATGTRLLEGCVLEDQLEVGPAPIIGVEPRFLRGL